MASWCSKPPICRKCIGDKNTVNSNEDTTIYNLFNIPNYHLLVWGIVIKNNWGKEFAGFLKESLKEYFWTCEGQRNGGVEKKWGTGKVATERKHIERNQKISMGYAKPEQSHKDDHGRELSW